MRERGIEPGSSEAKSLKFAGLRGMIASYLMMIVLITQKTDALGVIIVFGVLITIIQLVNANGGIKKLSDIAFKPASPLLPQEVENQMGLQRAHDEARQRGIVDAVENLIHSGAFAKFNVGPDRIRQLICYLYKINPDQFVHDDPHHERIEEPSEELQATYAAAISQEKRILRDIEDYSHFGIFTFIHNYYINWVSDEHGRGAAVVQKAMLNILFPQTEADVIWEEFSAYEPKVQPEPIWQFSRRRYLWAKDQWPNLSDRITTIWTLQDFGLISRDINVETVIAVADGKQQVLVKIPSNPTDNNDDETTKKALD